ncbi:MAG: hypothetical protein Q8M92_00810 [Candidatus Subteraquimicrobiales bacterium]|nr:hypothetical protein [Candidatus Subteraquimicrobiales bacterium]
MESGKWKVESQESRACLPAPEDARQWRAGQKSKEALEIEDSKY